MENRKFGILYILQEVWSFQDRDVELVSIFILLFNLFFLESYVVEFMLDTYIYAFLSMPARLDAKKKLCATFKLVKFIVWDCLWNLGDFLFCQVSICYSKE